MIVLKGSTFRIEVSVTKDKDGSPYPVDSNKLQVYDSKKQLISTITDVEGSNGLYHVDYTIPIDALNMGNWVTVWTIEINGRPDIVTDQFEVRDI